jgi:hypothetical protein
MTGPLLGGMIQNPQIAADQGLPFVEPLFINLVGPAELIGSDTTEVLQPGQFFKIPPGFTGTVSINAPSAGHRFSAIQVVAYTPPPPSSVGSGYPPTGAVTLTQTIGQYLYEQYNDDADLQAFVDAYNRMVQSYIEWFVSVPLPVYTTPAISGPLLDWVGTGLYGYPRPVLQSGRNTNIGPYNTFKFNQIVYNGFIRNTQQSVVTTDDDTYKRLLTWHLYKGDGKVFSVEWLKRRVIRFLAGVNGTDVDIDNTFAISVTFQSPNGVTIKISTVNTYGYTLSKVFYFIQAVASGVIEFPFQYQFTATTE